jgi:hypothetical protein
VILELDSDFRKTSHGGHFSVNKKYLELPLSRKTCLHLQQYDLAMHLSFPGIRYVVARATSLLAASNNKDTSILFTPLNVVPLK